MEFKRVLLNKKIICAFIFLVLICVAFYAGGEYRQAENEGVDFSLANRYRNELLSEIKVMPADKAEEEISSKLEYISTVHDLLSYDVMKTEDYESYAEIWLEQEIALRREHPEIAEEFDNNKSSLDMTELITREQVLSELLQQVQYIEGYGGYLNGIDEQAKNMNNISIFAKEDSLSAKNIAKTVEDYSPLKEISLTVGNDKPVTSVINFQLVHYLIFIFSLLVTLNFSGRGKDSLRSVIFATPEGRLRLSLKRGAILAFSVIFSTVVIYSILFGTSFLIYGGAEDIFRNIQSAEAFKSFVFPMSELEFIVTFVLINALTQLVPAFLVWLIVSFIPSLSIALGTAGVIFALEFVLYEFLPIQSNLSLLKCLNIFFFLNPTEAIIKYRNLNAFVIVINLFWLVVISAVVLVLVFAISAIWISAAKYPEKTPNRIEAFILKQLERVTELYRHAVEALPPLGTELYKILIIQKGWVVLAVFALVLVNSVDTGEIHYSAADSIINSFYEEYSGKVTSKTTRYVSDLEKDIENTDRELLKATHDYENGKISYDEYLTNLMKSDAYDGKREALEIIKERLAYIETCEAKGTEAWLVNPEGYSALLGSESFDRQQYYALLCLFCLVITVSGVFAYERRRKMKSMLIASYKGRQWLCHRKLICAAVITFLIWLFASAAELNGVYCVYGISQFSAPVKSLEFLQGLPFNISIGGFLILLYAARLLLLLACAYIVCLISSLARYEASLFLSLTVLILPTLFCMLGIEAFACVSAAVPIAAMELIISSKGYTFLIPMLLLLVLGIFALLITRRLWGEWKNGA